MHLYVHISYSTKLIKKQENSKLKEVYISKDESTIFCNIL